MREVREIMDTIRGFAAEDATIIHGAVYDVSMGDALRVTVVATGLGQPISTLQAKPRLVVSQKTGTDNMSMGNGFDGNAMDSLPAVMRKHRSQTVEALTNSGVDKYDIPAFLRKQAD